MFSTLPFCVLYVRDDNETDSEDTDDEYTWGGMGMFEYGSKGLPHALVHAPELVKTFGHHGACCTCVGEAGHKLTLKGAATFSRVYGDKNLTQDHMLRFVQRQSLWSEVYTLNTGADPMVPNEDDSNADVSSNVDSSGEHALVENNNTRFKLRVPLDYTNNWSTMVPTVQGRPPPLWGSTFLSKHVLITRNELLTLLRTKLDMEETWDNIARLAKLQWESFGCVIHEEKEQSVKRKFVGINPVSPGRRDFVRLKGNAEGTALSAQIIMFIRVSGFRNENIIVPVELRNESTHTCTRNSVTLALVRWLSPHPEAMLRDDELRPVCPPPFASNHALWKFTRQRRQRGYFTDHLFARQLHLFPGQDRQSQRRNALSLSYARFGLVNLESLQQFMNCTTADDDNDTILETITLPFV